MTGGPLSLANQLHVDPSELHAAPTPNQSAAQTNFFLNFESPELPQHLGFAQQRFPANGNLSLGNAYNILAVNPIKTLLLAGTFIVEMINMELGSYGTSQNQRRNILAIVPQEQTTNINNKQTVVYDTNCPLFVSLRNKDPISVRNLKARVLREDYSPLQIAGAAVMTMLVQ